MLFVHRCTLNKTPTLVHLSIVMLFTFPAQQCPHTCLDGYYFLLQKKIKKNASFKGLLVALWWENTFDLQHTILASVYIHRLFGITTFNGQALVPNMMLDYPSDREWHYRVSLVFITRVHSHFWTQEGT